MTTADLLRRALASASLTTVELAARAGVGKSTVYRILEGRTEPTLPTLVELLNAGGLSLDLRTEALYDLAAAEAARIMLGELDATPSSTVWVDRLRRRAGADRRAVVREAGAATAALRAPGAVGLRGESWEVDRLVSAGRASGSRWALSGWAALDAMGHAVQCSTVFWTDDVRRIRQLLSDTMTVAPVEGADVIVVPAGDFVFAGVIDVDDVVLVAQGQALIDGVGLGGEAAEVSLALAEGLR